MPSYRRISTAFWTDPKVDDEFTPEDKYFYLYLLTNPHTSISGCYEISKKQIERETGYTWETSSRIIKRFENVHKVLKYDESTKEILLLNWKKYNWGESPKVVNAVVEAAKQIKNAEFKAYVLTAVNGGSKPEPEKPEAPDTEPEAGTTPIQEIIDYLNAKTGKKYRSNTGKTKSLINARLKEGFTTSDFKKVIDNKVAAWKGGDFEKYLRPETLFGTKFEGYLNESPKAKSYNGLADGDGDLPF